MPNSQQSENEQQESFTGYKNVCESARFACDFAHLTQPKIQNHHLKTKTIFFLIFDFITFRLFNQTVTKFCLYKYKATKYFRHKLEFLLQKFRIIGNQGVRMKIMDEVQKRNFRREVQRKSFIFNKSEVPEDMKVIFCFFVYAKAKNKFAAANFKNASVFEVKRLSVLVKMLRRFWAKYEY